MYQNYILHRTVPVPHIYVWGEGRSLVHWGYLSDFWIFSHHVSETDVHQVCTTADTNYPPFQIIF